MTYQIFHPTAQLRPYIEQYWLLSGYHPEQEIITLLPDGRINLVLNLGEEIESIGYRQRIRHEGIFLVGIMMQLDQQVLCGESRMFGIQFKPGGFTHFYPHGLLEQSANQVQEFNKQLFPDLKKLNQYFIPYVDQYFLDRLKIPRNSMMEVLMEIERLKGQVKIGALAKRFFTTERQLERRFLQQTGIPPKEYISLTRFRSVLTQVQNKNCQRSLGELAFECGYYDHAHLSNDFRRYTGISPTSFILSDFSKLLAVEPG